MPNTTLVYSPTCNRGEKRRSWEVWGTVIRVFGWPVIETRLGWINARSAAAALEKAKLKWPGRRLNVCAPRRSRA